MDDDIEIMMIGLIATVVWFVVLMYYLMIGYGI